MPTPRGEASRYAATGAVSAYRVISLEPPARAQTLAFVGLDEEGSTRTVGFGR
jgi:hypothetical protein